MALKAKYEKWHRIQVLKNVLLNNLLFSMKYAKKSLIEDFSINRLYW